MGRNLSPQTHFFIYEMEIKVLHPWDYCETWNLINLAQCLAYNRWSTNAIPSKIFKLPSIFLLLPHCCCIGQALKTNCLLHFLKLALSAKNRNRSQRKNVLCLSIDLRSKEQKQLWSQITVSLGATQSWLP